MKYLKVYLIAMLIIIVGTIILGSLSYANIISENIFNILKSLTVFLSSFLGGYTLGGKASEKGYLEGVKIGSFISLTFLIIGFLLYRKFRLQKFILSLLILLVSVLGSIIGINKKKEKNKNH